MRESLSFARLDKTPEGILCLTVRDPESSGPWKVSCPWTSGEWAQAVPHLGEWGKAWMEPMPICPSKHTDGDGQRSFMWNSIAGGQDPGAGLYSYFTWVIRVDEELDFPSAGIQLPSAPRFSWGQHWDIGLEARTYFFFPSGFHYPSASLYLGPEGLINQQCILFPLPK